MSEMPATAAWPAFDEALTSAAYEAAWRYAYRLTRQRGGSYEDAEDLLQESLAQAYRRFDQLRHPDKFTGWLISIIRNRFINRLRRGRQRGSSAAELPPEPVAAEQDPLAAQLKEALSLMPTGPRELLSLFYLDGLSLKETAQVLGITPRAVRQRLFRARAALRRQVKLPEEASAHVTRHPGSSQGATS